MLVEDDQVALISQLYSGLYTDQAAPPKEPPKRRRRRKNKGDGSLSEAKKRKLSDEQVNMLEISFGCEHKLESERKDRLASELGLDPRQVAVWFQNRRARWKNKKLEEEFSKLRKDHETLVVDKCRLETEVVSLKDQLKDARVEIQKLQERPTISTSHEQQVSSHHSPSSSMTIEYHQTNNNNIINNNNNNNHKNIINNNNNNVMDSQILGGEQFGIEGGCLDAMFFVPNTNYVPTIEWMDLCDM